MKVLFVAAEGLPFSKTGGLADVIEALPKALVAKGHRVAVVLPRYRGIECKKIVLRGLKVPIGKAVRSPVIAEGPQLHGVQYFFVDDPEYFDRAAALWRGRQGLSGQCANASANSAGRRSNSRSQVWTPDVFHCHDWQTGAGAGAAAYGLYRAIRAARGAGSLHHSQHGLSRIVSERSCWRRLGCRRHCFVRRRLNFSASVNYLEGRVGLFGLSDDGEPQIRAGNSNAGLWSWAGWCGARARGPADRHFEWRGLLGVEPGDRRADRGEIFREGFQGQEACKKDLLQEFGLAENAENAKRPLIGIVSRFADQKGFDLWRRRRTN